MAKAPQMEQHQHELGTNDKARCWDRIGVLQTEIDERKEELKQLLEASKTGRAVVTHEISWSMDDPRPGIKRKVCVETGETLLETPMSDDDRQVTLDDLGNGRARRRRNGHDPQAEV